MRWSSGEIRNSLSDWIISNIRLSDTITTTLRNVSETVVSVIGAIPGKRYILYGL